jgi:HSP20 family protein
MNLLHHKELLHGLLKQGDILNTLNGGGAMTYVEEQAYDDHVILSFWAPTVPAESFNVVVNNNTLVVFSLLASAGAEQEVSSFNIPMFFRKFTLPSYADNDNIEAVHEEDRLSIIIPYKNGSVPVRKINIRQDHDKK